VKVLLCPKEIAGYMGRLKNGFLKNGVQARFLEIYDNPMSYSGADHSNLSSAVKSIRHFRKRIGVFGFLLLPIELLFRIMLVVYSLIWPDVVIFCFGNTFLGGVELPLYQIFKVKTVFVYLGSDSRPYYLNGATASKARGISYKECFKKTKKQKKRIKWQERYADFIIDHPPSGVFHEKAFYPFMLLGMPIPDIGPAVVPAVEGTVGRAIRILHAPSFPECKGTENIRGIIEGMLSVGYNCEYVEISERPNNEVLEALSECDFVVDELYSDTVLAGLGTEAAIAGKPALVGGYTGGKGYGVTPGQIPPAFMARPEQVSTVLKSMLDDPEGIRRKGEEAKAFVTKYWNADAVASRYLAMFRGELVESIYDPNKTIETMGWGFSAQRLGDFLRDYVGCFGSEGLFLDDKPILRDWLLNLARESLNA